MNPDTNGLQTQLGCGFPNYLTLRIIKKPQPACSTYNLWTSSGVFVKESLDESLHVLNILRVLLHLENWLFAENLTEPLLPNAKRRSFDHLLAKTVMN
jgi:hypothetical protein